MNITTQVEFTRVSHFLDSLHIFTLRAFSIFYFASRYNANVEMFRTTRITHS